jgi:alkylated DNA repair dioxygenase AlkB
MEFIINKPYPLGNSKIWYSKVNITDTKNLFNHLKTLEFEKGDYNGRHIRREQRWYHRFGTYFNPKWKRYRRWESYPYDSYLDMIELRVNYFVKHIINPEEEWICNSILINRYENEENLIPKHRDSEVIFGDNPTIAIYSIGAARTIRFTPVNPYSNVQINGTKVIDVRLEDGSLLLMSGTVQKYYLHEILKETEDTEERFSITCRVHKM